MSFLPRPHRLAAARAAAFRFFAAPGALAVVALLTLGAGGLACDDDGDGPGVDAGPDGGLGTACKVADCMRMPMPMHLCMNGGKASYVCARALGGACVWDQPVCKPDTEVDGGGDGDTASSEVGDGAPDDDALDAAQTDAD